MDISEVIKVKRDGGKLSKEEIEWFVAASTSHEIADYQISAMLMAMFINGLDDEETAQLTIAMRDSGEKPDLSSIPGIKVDKHSTGGVGDKTTLSACPLAAACGAKVAKMSGRGLGFTGGTVDKLSAVPGYVTALSEEEFFDVVRKTGISVVSQTKNIAAADKIFYALRDVTATVDSIPLISASIMSKKLALGSDAILLDVKCGEAAFMNDIDEAGKLARTMTEIGARAGKKVVAMITAMDQPLGKAVGNTLEIKEAIEVLKGNGPEDITKLSVSIAGMMIYLAEKAESHEQGMAMAAEALKDGRGLMKLKEMIEGQGGDPAVCDDPDAVMGTAKYSRDVVCKTDGYVNKIHGVTIGLASMNAGAGRKKMDDVIDLRAGILLEKKVGDAVSVGNTLCTVFADNETKLEDACRTAESAFVIEECAPEKTPLILDIVTNGSI